MNTREKILLVALGECDRHPEREAELTLQLEAHVRLFHRTFAAPAQERTGTSERKEIP